MPKGSWRFIDEEKGSEIPKETNKKNKWRFIDDNEEEPVQKQSIPGHSPDYELSDLARIPANIGSYIASGLGGVPKSLASGAQYAIEKGSDIQDYLQDIGESPEQIQQNRQAREGIKKTTGNPFSTLARQTQEALPTEEDIEKKIGNQLPEDFLKPKSMEEKYLYDAAKTFGSMLFPLSPGFKVNAGKNAILAGSGKLGRYLKHKISGSDTGGELVELGTMLGVGYKMAPYFKDIAKKEYDDLSKESIENSINMVIPESTTEKFKELYKKLTIGGGKAVTQNRNLIQNVLPEWEPYFNGANPKIPFPEFMELIQRGNEVKGEMPLFSRARGQLSDFLKVLKGNTKHIAQGSSEAAPYAKRLINNNQIWSSVKSSEDAWDFIRNNKITSGLAAATFLGPIITGHKTLAEQAPYAVGAGALAGGYLGLNKGLNYLKYPAVRNEVANVLKDSLSQNAAGASKHLKKLIKAQNKVDKDNPQKEYILDRNQNKKPLEYILER